MKKICSLVAVTFILFNLCSCGISYEVETPGVITREELMEYSEYTELTTENWNEYFEIIRTESDITDVFGEETGTHVWNNIVLKDGCYISVDNAMRLTYSRDDGILWTDDIVFKDSMVYGEDMYKRGSMLHPNKSGDVTCEKIKGTILRLSLPEEKWAVDDEGRKYIEVKGEERTTIVYYNYRTINYDAFASEN